MKIRPLLSTLIVILIFFFIGRAIYLNWHLVLELKGDLKYPPLLLSLFLGAGAITISGLTWTSIIRQLHGEISARRILRIFAHSIFGRYIPGLVWETVSRTNLASREGIKPATVVAATVYELLYSSLSAGIIILVSFMSPSYRQLVPIWLVSLVITGLVLASIFSRHLLKIGFQKLRVTFEPRNMWPFGPIAMYILFFSAYGLGFAFFSASIAGGLDNLIYFIAAYSFSIFMGTFNITPAGLGIREGILTVALGAVLPLPVAALISVLARIWTMVSELIFYLPTLFFTRSVKTTSS